MTTMTTMTATTTTTERAAGRSADRRWQQHDFRAMNTRVHLSLYSTSTRSMASHVEGLFRYFERALSRFRPDSELSRLNGHDDTAFAAGPDLYAAVEAAVWAAQQSGGIYDPTILPYLEAAGYDRSFDLMTAVPAGPALTPAAIGRADTSSALGFSYRDIVVDRFTQMIYRPVGLRLDLGGMGKGWTVDRVADELRPKGAFMLNAGGDLYVTDAPHREQGWRVHLMHPLEPGRFIATLSLAHRALATSTVARRRWMKDGFLQHHLIDPRTGRPAATDALSVSVTTSRVFTAEIHAKVALILGLTDGLEYLEALPDVEGVLVAANGAIHQTTGMTRFLDRLDPDGYDDESQGE